MARAVAMVVTVKASIVSCDGGGEKNDDSWKCTEPTGLPGLPPPTHEKGARPKQQTQQHCEQ